MQESSLFQDTPFTLGDVTLNSRLLLGTGKYPTLSIMQQCHNASETEMVTVALRKIPLQKNSTYHVSILDYINLNKIHLPAVIGYLSFFSNIYYHEYELNKIWFGDMFSINNWIKMNVT